MTTTYRHPDLTPTIGDLEGPVLCLDCDGEGGDHDRCCGTCGGTGEVG